MPLDPFSWVLCNKARYGSRYVKQKKCREFAYDGPHIGDGGPGHLLVGFLTKASERSECQQRFPITGVPTKLLTSRLSGLLMLRMSVTTSGSPSSFVKAMCSSSPLPPRCAPPQRCECPAPLNCTIPMCRSTTSRSPFFQTRLATKLSRFLKIFSRLVPSRKKPWRADYSIIDVRLTRAYYMSFQYDRNVTTLNQLLLSPRLLEVALESIWEHDFGM